MNDQEIVRFLKPSIPVFKSAEAEWFDNLPKRKEDVVLAIEDLEKPGVIGNMGLHKIKWIDGTATTGAVIGNKDYWNKGYGADAKMILLNYAFNSLNLRKICSGAYGFSQRSVTYNQKCGCKIEGIRKAHIFREGQYFDIVDLAIFREDWEPIWEYFKSHDGHFPPKKST
jgi:RimJ/RimL family protein N-acetyltransferase